MIMSFTFIISVKSYKEASTNLFCFQEESYGVFYKNRRIVLKPMDHEYCGMVEVM